MQRPAMQGMWGRYALFVAVSFGILLLNIYLMSLFRPKGGDLPPGEEVAGSPDGGEHQAPTVEGEEEPVSPDAEGQPPHGEPTDPTEPTEPTEPAAEGQDPPDAEPAPAAEEPPAAPEEPEVPAEWVTLGSADPKSPYRMLVTLSNRGAAVARIELSSPRFHDLEDRSGYLGHVVMDPTLRGSGCQVQVVGSGTPAARAGLKEGDLIKRVADERVTGFRSLQKALEKTKPNQTVELTVVRGGREITLPVTLGRRPLEVVRPEQDDPLSFLLTLRQIDKLSLDDLKKEIEEGDDEAEDGEKKEDEKKSGIKRDKTIGLELAGLKLRTGNWEVVSHNETQVEFRRALPKWGLEVTKTYRLAKVPAKSIDDDNYRAYHLDFTVQIRNTGQKTRQVAYQLDGPNGLPTEGAWYARKVGRGWGAVGLRDVVVSLDEGIPKLVSCPDIADDDWGTVWKEEDEGVLSFVGVDAQYFAAVMIPQKKKPEDIWFAESQPLRVGAVDSKWKSLTNTSCRMSSTLRSLKPGDTLSHSYEVFAGPKRPELLAKYAGGGLKELIVYGWFWWVAIPMLWTLHVFYAMVRNYGVAILLLTVLVRCCLFPLSRKMALNAQKMQELQPEIKKLQEKYKTNLEARTKAQQKLFKDHNYNPLAGCLPMFLQLPIFIGLYRGLMVDVELRQAPLLWDAVRWCSNLAAPDMLFNWSSFMPDFVSNGQGFFGLGPYLNLLPILTVVLILVQQKMFMPPPADEQAAMQQNVMKFMMIFMALIFFKVASGLCIYFIASSLWGIAERKLLPKSRAAGADDKSKQRKSPRFQGLRERLRRVKWLQVVFEAIRRLRDEQTQATSKKPKSEPKSEPEKGRGRKPQEAEVQRPKSPAKTAPGPDGAAARKQAEPGAEESKAQRAGPEEYQPQGAETRQPKSPREEAGSDGAAAGTKGSKNRRNKNRKSKNRKKKGRNR